MEINPCRKALAPGNGAKTIIGLVFDPSDDIHLIQKSKWLLKPQLAVLYSDGKQTNLKAVEDLIEGVEFKPFFGDQVSIPTKPEYQSFGSIIRTISGEVEVTERIKPAQSFVVQATLYLKTRADGSTPEPLKASIRVHMHDSVKRIWLTPSRLPIHYLPPGNPSPRLNGGFTVMAVFEDDVIADITNWQTNLISTQSGTVVRFDWTHENGALLQIDHDYIQCLKRPVQGTAVEDTVTFTLKLPGITDFSSSAKVVVKNLWESGLEVTPVGKSSNPNYKAVPNILFLPDGLVEKEKPVFKAIVEKIVAGLSTNPILSPYPELAGSINYWHAFVASEERGINLLDQYPVQKQTPKITGDPLGETIVESKDLRELIQKVGPPVPKEADFSLEQKQEEWRKLYDPIPDVSPALFNRWRALARLSFINERGTAFGIALGQRSLVEQFAQGGTNSLRFHPRRIDDSYFRRFLASLYFKDSNNNGEKVVIGPTWIGYDEKGSPLPVGQRGKDAGLVCIIARGTQVRGEKNDDYLAVTLPFYVEKKSFEALDPKSKGGEKGYHLNPPAINSYEPPTVFIAIVAHEFAHAFGLHDEYGETETLKLTRDQIDGGNGSAGCPNLQAYTSLYPEDKLDPALIKWNLPRIRKAGVLAAQPEVKGGELQVKLMPGHAGQFEVDKDIVHLRKRSLGLPIPTESLALKVKSVNKKTDTLILVPYGTWNLTNFPVNNYPAVSAEDRIADNSIVFVPVRTREKGEAIGETLRLIAPAVLRHMNNGGPLNAPGDNPTKGCNPDPKAAFEFMQPTNLPPVLPRISKPYVAKPNIIGLYEGGGNHGCCVFRPAGDCLMRGLNLKLRASIKRFCHVCKYAIVDRVDPTKHGAIDALYDAIYPGPEHD